MNKYYSTNLHNHHPRRSNPWPIISLIALIIIGYLFWPRNANHSPNNPSPSPTSTPAVLNYKIDSSLTFKFLPLFNQFLKENPNITLTAISAKINPDIIFSINPHETNKFLASRTIFSSKLIFTPDKLNDTFKKNKDLNIIAEYNPTNQSAKSLADYLSKILNTKYQIQTTVLAVGDIMLSRHVYTITKNTGNYNYPFLQTYTKLKSADITFANFEAPIYNQGAPVTEGMIFKVEPKMTSGIKLSGFDILSLANNHFGNQGQAGMLYTTKYLRKNNINYCGGGKDDKEAYAPAYITKNNLIFAFLCYTDPNIDPRIAGPNKPGNAMMYQSKLKEGIATARKNADVVIVSMHSGTEYTPDPNYNQQKFAHLAIKYGADIVIGHHPHVVEAIEMYKGRPILYSLGNFVFDQMWSTETTQGIGVNITFTGSQISKIDIMPLKIRNYAQPYFLPENSEYNSIINRIITASQKLKE